MFDIDDIPLNILEETASLSVRAYHVCNNNSLLSLKSILVYHHINHDFFSLRNCGKKTNNELIRLCNKNNYSKLIKEINNENNSKDNDIISKINSLSPFQRNMLDNYLLFLIYRLNLRAKNIMLEMSKPINTEYIFQTIFPEDFTFSHIKGVGVKVNNELKMLKLSLISFIKKLQNLKKEDFNKDFCEFLLKMAYPSLKNVLHELFEQMYDEKGQLKIFVILKFLIEKRQIFPRRELIIFSYLYTDNFDKKDLYKSFGSYQELTKERIRQIAINLEANLSSYLYIVRILKNAKILTYGIDDTKPLQIIDKDLTKKININEKTNFNSRFCNIIISELYSTTHSVLRKKEWLLWKNHNSKMDIYNTNFLISNSINNSFDFKAFMNDVLIRIRARKETNYQINFEDYIQKYLINGAKPNMSELIYACKTIVKLEFNLEVNPDGYLVFYRTTKRKVYEYCYDILNKAQTNMSLTQIYNALVKDYSYINCNTISLRSILTTHSDLFISFGRSSVYGLKQWEADRPNIKGGSIRTMVYEYLKNEDEPKHITEIFEYVSKYRPTTTASSLSSSLLMDKSSRFLKLNGRYIGLKEKTYSPESTKTININGSHFGGKLLRKFEGWEMDDILSYFQKKCNYKPVQIRHILERKIIEGKLIVKK